jgi:hypothetical protein
MREEKIIKVITISNYTPMIKMIFFQTLIKNLWIIIIRKQGLTVDKVVLILKTCENF